mgnify:CR=1 FL=1
MKRYQWMGIMLSLVLLLCSCGTDKEVEKKAGESTSTPSATASVTPLISEDEAFSEAEKIVKTMTIEQKVGQMFLVDLLQLDASPSVDGTAYKATDSMKQAIIDYENRMCLKETPEQVERIKKNPTKYIRELEIDWSDGYAGEKGDWFKNINIPLNCGLLSSEIKEMENLQ